MAKQTPTLDELWITLGLDSLPGDAGTAVGLASTRMTDWAQATAPGVPPRPEHSERVDLPRLTLAPPRLGSDEVERELIVTGLLGEGGMARVLLAHQASLGRDVAVKVARAQAAAGTISALVHEARTTGGLEHPAVIPVYAMASDAAGQPALVMKRVDGVAWSELLADAGHPMWQRLAAPAAARLEAHVEILRQVCNAIAFAHRRGVIHRDLKPANVLIGEFGEVYVADWGIAIPKTDRSTVPSLVGTPLYLAPEMVSGDDARMDERTDVFLLGAILYQLLTGAPPWSGPDLRAVLEQAAACRPRPVPADAPSELAAICVRAMAADPRQRYPSALEFREALGDFLRHRGSVSLARAAGDRLVTLLSSLPNADRDNVYALLSECRFGFTQALAEWPQNEAARAGLARCLEATARHELSQGNLGAARVLIRELSPAPAELLQLLAAAERQVAAAERQKEVLARLSQEMDPRVAFRQRVLAFGAVALGACAVAVAPRLVPSLDAALRSFGPQWYLTLLAAAVVAVFALALWLGRRTLLSTRVNRRVMGIVGAAGGGLVLQRVAAVVSGLDTRATVIQNFVLVIAVCMTGAIALHSGFFWSAGAMTVGLAITLLVPGDEGALFAVANAVALIVAALSWRSWRGEFTERQRPP